MRRLPALALCLSVVACASAQQTTNQPSPTQTPQGPLAQPAVMPGHWLSDCAQDTDASGLNELTITATGMTLASKVFSDLTCAKPQTILSLTSDYTLGAASAAVDGAKDLDLQPKQAMLTIMDEKVLATANEQKLYGLSDWRIGEGKDVTGRDIKGEGGVQPTKPLYTIVKFDHNRLFLGALQKPEDDNSKAEGRDKILNLETIYFRN